MNRRSIHYHRKVYIFAVEKFVQLIEWPSGASSEEWTSCGLCILPDNAYRDEVAHALMAFNIAAPRGADKLTWATSSYARPCSDDHPDATSSWPRARISDVKGVPLARLSARRGSHRNMKQLERDKG